MSSSAEHIDPTHTDQWITFTLGTGTYVLPIDSVEEIIRYEQPTPVPDSPCEVDGLLNVRGSLVTVISGHKLLNLDASETSNESRIIILGTTCGLVGICVDAVDDIVAFNANEAEVSQEYSARKIIKGTIMHQDRLLILVELYDYLDGHEKPQ